uniref:Centrosomal protein of 44 kDa n=1 Tax=Crassostrea virginica TaxID=6565 RepID=A0A8B8D9G4_CRAVI|nr:uncharacterized protein LOC111125095 [Crassostrea virginica]
MATGDLTNNIRKLQKELKSMKYPENLDLNGLAQGKASALLPIYHYAFTTYSCAIAELIAGTDTELYTKTDLRFMEGCYKILRDLFHYKPPITKDQFFNSGFVERKIIMCTEVMKLIQQKNKSLQPPRKSNSTSTSNLAQVISTKPNKGKVTDLTQVRPGHQRLRPRSSTDGAQREGMLETRSGTSPRSLPETDQPQVVNELLQPVGTIPRHVAHHGLESEQTQDGDSSSETSGREFTQRSPPVHVASVASPPRVTKEVLPSVGRDVRGFNWAVVTPSIAKTKSQFTSSNGQTQVLFDEDEEEDDDDDDDDDDEGDNDIETVVAATPAHSIMEPPQNGVTTMPSQNGVTSGLKQNRVTAETFDRSPCVEPETVQNSPQSSTNETHILKAIEQLTKCFGTLESGLTRSIESLNARMILVEKRVSMMENKIEMVVSGRMDQPSSRVVSAPLTNASGQKEQIMPSLPSHRDQAEIHMNRFQQTKDSREPQPITTNLSTRKTPDHKGPPSQSALYDESTLVMFSPIRRVTEPALHQQTPETTFYSTSNDTRDPRLSSTPARSVTEMDTQLVLGESMNLNTDDANTQDQVNRIKNLFKSTEIMLKQ